jgi:hypothetical protein
MHEGSRRGLDRREVDVARRLAPRALDLQPRKAAVDGLIDGGRGINRLPVALHSLVPAFAEQLVSLLNERFTRVHTPYPADARLRVHRAPGIPRALFSEGDNQGINSRRATGARGRLSCAPSCLTFESAERLTR